MAFPTSGFSVAEVAANVAWHVSPSNSPQSGTLRFSLLYGGDGVTEACYEQAITDAVDAFAAALDVEATIDGVIYVYSGTKEV